VPIEGVVNALRSIHAALAAGGIVVDTQPLSPRPPVEADGRPLGTLDMREWRRTIDAVDVQIGHAIAQGLFTCDGEHSCVVADEFDSGAEFIEVVGGWRGTRIPAALIRRVLAAPPPVRVHQEVRLRLLRARPTV
jgi:hypothetical protein